MHFTQYKFRTEIRLYAFNFENSCALLQDHSSSFVAMYFNILNFMNIEVASAVAYNYVFHKFGQIGLFKDHFSTWLIQYLCFIPRPSTMVTQNNVFNLYMYYHLQCI